MAESNTRERKYDGFERGLVAVANSRTKVEYDQCFREVRTVCLTTEERGNSGSSFYNKRYGCMALTTKEAELIGEVFARYGVEEWRGQA